MGSSSSASNRSTEHVAITSQNQVPPLDQSFRDTKNVNKITAPKEKQLESLKVKSVANEHSKVNQGNASKSVASDKQLDLSVVKLTASDGKEKNGSKPSGSEVKSVDARSSPTKNQSVSDEQDNPNQEDQDLFTASLR